MRLKIVCIVAAILLASAAFGCGSSSSPSSDEEQLQSLAKEVDASRMMETVEYLASEELSGRPAGSPASATLEEYLEARLEELGLDPVGRLGLDGYRQEFQVPAERCFLEEEMPADATVTCANLIGGIPGEPDSEMVVFTANYDGLGRDAETGDIYPGADYNASGAAAVLELARVFSSRKEKPAKTMVFALLGAEECGAYGSQALADALQANDLRQSVRIINLEGLGAGDGDYMDIWDLNYRKNRPTVEAMDSAAYALDVELELGGADPGTAASIFFLYHLPAVTCDWSWFERGEHPDFHLPSDTPDKIDQDGLLAVTKVVAGAGWLLAQ
jgi:Peptidase family M28